MLSSMLKYSNACTYYFYGYLKYLTVQYRMVHKVSFRPTQRNSFSKRTQPNPKPQSQKIKNRAEGVALR